ncbi:hypothetical protein N9I48_00925 [Candidatus Pelagibacter sp.]|nr:hypothetical protein [Candidatus Pelagibacter sp.]
MEKKIFTFILLIFLSSCGYEAIYSVKNMKKYNFSISKLSFIGDREINLKIKQKLNNYTKEIKDINFILKITSTSEKIILAKDTAGDSTNFKIETVVNIDVFNNEKLKNNFIILESFNYDNNSNKFELKNYEKEIKRNLAEIIAEKLIFKLANIK